MPLGAFKAALMGTAGVATAESGDITLLQSQTASNAASLTFSGKMSDTYEKYIFKFYNINPATDDVDFTFQVNATDGADFNDSLITSTYFYAIHSEADDQAAEAYGTADDQAQGSAFQAVADAIGNGADESCAGELHMFNPASTTYVKHFHSRVQMYHGGNMSVDRFASGYINDTTAIDDIQFKMSSGNFDGVIKMWGVKF